MLSLKQYDNFVQKFSLEKVKTNPKIRLAVPTRLGYFSFYCNNENEAVYCSDESSLRYLDLPKAVSIDCLQGYDSNIKYGHEEPKRVNLLRWIFENETIVRHFTYDFICNCSLLKDLMISSYTSSNWNLYAVKIKGKIILNRVKSTENGSIVTRSDQDRKSSYAASNLPRLITKNNNHSKCFDGQENDSFHGVFHSKIGSHQILYSGYLDCVKNKDELNKTFDKMNFVLIRNYNAPSKSHTSLQANTWWSLARLTGVSTVIRAKCEQNFTVKNIDKLEIGSLIRKSTKMKFVGSLNLILDHFKSIVVHENRCYHFHFNGKDRKLACYESGIR